MHAGSRTTRLDAMTVGSCEWFDLPAGRSEANFRSNLVGDSRRIEKKNADVAFSQKKWIAVDPVTAETVILIQVTKHLKEIE